MNRRLTDDELEKAWDVIRRARAEIGELSAGDRSLQIAYLRKIWKELYYIERDRPLARRTLKARKRQDQGGICPLCRKELPDKYAVLDRLEAQGGYTLENTRLIHAECDREQQEARGYK